MDWEALLASLCLSPEGDGSVGLQDDPAVETEEVETGDEVVQTEDPDDTDDIIEDDLEDDPDEEIVEEEPDADEPEVDPRDAKIEALESQLTKAMTILEAQVEKQRQPEQKPVDDKYAKVKAVLSKMKPEEREFYEGLIDMTMHERGYDQIPEKIKAREADQEFNSWLSENQWGDGYTPQDLGEAANEYAQTSLESDVALAQTALKAAAWDKYLKEGSDKDVSDAKERQRRLKAQNKKKSAVNRDRTDAPVLGKGSDKAEGIGVDDDYPDPEGLLARLQADLA